MIVGSIGYECHSGLGHLMRDFYHHGVVDRVLVVPHSHYRNYTNWYPPGARFTKRQGAAFLNGLDVLLVFENAFYWDLAAQAKKRGTKFVIIPNYEYTPFPPNVEPDLFLCGSLLDVDYYSPRWKTRLITIPVDTNRFPWRARSKAEVIIHNAGHGQRGWAKGTPQVVEAMSLVKSDARLILRMQPGEKRTVQFRSEFRSSNNIDFRFGEFDESQLYAEGDVFLNAEQYNGMSLMLQEAFASGLAVMSTDRYPANTWLPKDMLLPMDHCENDRICVEFQRSIVIPETIAARIDEWYGRDISSLSEQGRQWAENHSWNVRAPALRKILEDVCSGRCTEEQC